MLYSFLCVNADKKDVPIDRAVVVVYENSEAAKSYAEYTGLKQDSLIGFNPEVKRVVAFCSTKDGKVITLAKRLPAKIIDTGFGG
jgi:hypothetical protein